jgi:hypothetical protein
MKVKWGWRAVFVRVLGFAMAVSFATPMGAQPQQGEDPSAASALAAQRSALAESILATKEAARGEGFDAAIRADLKRRMETLSVEQLAALAEKGARADIPKVLGAATNDLVYTPVTPCRVFDSRVSQGGQGPLLVGTPRDVRVTGTTGFPAQGGLAGGCGILTGATSVIINFVAVTPSGTGNLRAYAVASPQPGAPLAATINYGVVPNLSALANGLAVPICNPAATSCVAGDLRLEAFGSSTEVLGDVVGYFRAPTSVPGTVVDAVFASGTGGFIVPTSALFLGPTVNVTVTSTQKVHVWATKALGSTVGASGLSLSICYRSTVLGSPIVLVGTGSTGYTAAAGQKHSFSLSAVWGPTTADTYETGLCGLAFPAGQAPNWNFGGDGYVTAQVLNP